MAARSPVVTVLAIGMAATIGLGIARFAYSLVLPAMRAELDLSYGQAGWLNTTNALGYLLGAMAAPRVAARFGTRGMTLWGVVACIASLALCAASRDLFVLNVARSVAGLGGAFAFVGGGAMAARLAGEAGAAGRGRSGTVLGLYYAMPGVGIALSGVLVPAVIAAGGTAAWPTAWWVLAAFCVPLAAWLLLGSRGQDIRIAAAGRAAAVPMGWIGFGYFLFGAGYIGYMTFMIAFVRDGGGGPAAQGAFWVTIGAGAVASAWLWRGVLERLAGGRAFALLCALCAGGAAIPVFGDDYVLLLVSAALFGSTFFSVVASTTAFVRRNYGPEGWTRGIGALTVVFGLGQIVGPTLVGLVNDATGDLTIGLLASALLLVLGAFVALPQRDQKGA